MSEAELEEEWVIKKEIEIDPASDFDGMRRTGYEELYDEYGDIIDRIIEDSLQANCVNISENIVQNLYDNPEIIERAQEAGNDE